MASLRSVMRLAPRIQPIRFTTIAQRTYVRRPATDDKPVREAEEASEDLNMNGNYPDPSLTSALPIKRQFRDPYAEWWDPQERRNYGEPLHEDNDILGIFTPEEYTHFSPGWGGVLIGSFVGAVGVLMAVVYRYYPDRVSVTRTFEDGLEAELGGPKAIRARNHNEGDVAPLDRSVL